MARWLGIDVGSTMVRWRWLRSTYRKTQLVALREERHRRFRVAERRGSFGHHGAANGQLRGRHRRKKGFMRRIDLPRAAQKELQSVLSYEVESTLPFELEDAVMDHRRLNHRRIGRRRGAAVVRGGGVTEVVARPHRAGQARLWRRAEPRRHRPIAAREPDTGGARPRRRRADGHHRSRRRWLRRPHPTWWRATFRPVDRARYRRLTGRSGRPGPRSAADLRRLARQRGAPIARALVVGPGRETPGLEGFCRTELDVALVDLPKLALDDVAAEQEAMLPRFAKAIALALSLSKKGADLNLRQGHSRRSRASSSCARKTPLLSGLAAAIIVSFGFASFAEMRALDAEKKALGAQLEAATKSYFGKFDRGRERGGRPARCRVVRQARRPDATARRLRRDERDERPHPAQRGARHPRLRPEEEHRVGQRSGQHHRGRQDVETEMQKYECFKDVNLSHTTKLKEKNKQKVHARAQGRLRQGQGKKPARPPLREETSDPQEPEVSLQTRFEKLSPREQRLLTVFGGVVGAMLVLGAPAYLFSAVSSARQDNADVRAQLRRMDSAAQLLSDRRAAREAREALYAKAQVPLASFVESGARAQTSTCPSRATSPTPFLKGYVEHATQLKFRQGRPAGPGVRARADRKSGLPIAVTSLHVSSRSTPDEYDVTLTVSQYEKKAAPRTRSTRPEPKKGQSL